MDQRRRRTFSFLLPIAGLIITVPELLRLVEARRVADACVAQAGEQGACPPGPDVLFFVIAGALGLVFALRLIVVVLEYWRAARP